MILLLVAGLALAQPTFTDGDTAFQAARTAERDGDPAGQLAACQAVLELGASRRAEQACRERLAWLDAHRDPDGGLGGLIRLEGLRQGSGGSWEALESDPTVSDAVRAAAANGLAAVALREERGTDALALTSRWWPGEGLPEQTRQRLGRLHAKALVLVGRVEDAYGVEQAMARPDAPTPTPTEVSDLVAARRAQLGAKLSGGMLVLWGLAALPLAAVGWRQRPRPRPLGLVPLAVVGGGGWLLAVRWERSLAEPLALLLAVLAALHLLALGGSLALRSRATWLRALFGGGSAAATVAAAFLVLHQARLLAWVGL